MGNRPNALLLLTLLASISSVVRCDCSINEIDNLDLCGGKLTCDGNFNDARNAILKMSCLHMDDEDPEETEDTYTYLSHQNYSISVAASGFDFISANDTLALTELSDHISDISVTGGRIKKLPNIVSKLRQATIVDFSSNKINYLNLSAFAAPSKLTVLNISYNDIASLADVTRWQTNTTIPLNSIDLSHNNIRGNLINCIPPYQNLSHLNLSFNLIETFHQTAIRKMASLESLDMSNNRVTELGTALSGLAKLKILFLNNNNLKSVTKDNFHGMVSLQYLNISCNSLKSIDNSAFNTLTALSQLDMSNNQIKVLSKSMFINNNNLRSVNVAFNNIQRIESGAFAGAHIEDLKLHNNTLAGRLDTDSFSGVYIDRLDLSGGRLTELGPEMFGSNPSFQSLNFSKNMISKISKTAFRRLRLLDTLDLSYNKLQDIEFDMIDLTNLTRYYLNNNLIRKITKNSFNSLISVIEIDLSNNAVEFIEAMSFQNLKNLHSLNLKNNPLADIRPQTFTGLTSCYSLDISGTKLKQLKDNTFIGLESLNRLNLSKSYLRDLEFNVFYGLQSIEFLDLSHNQIESLFINNTNDKLQQLTLSWNNIRTISKTFFENLQQVTQIDLSNNVISSIQPGSFRGCHMLKILNMSNNMLTSLQFGVFNGLEQLQTIDLSNNKFRRFDAKIFNDYYARDRYEIEAIYLDNNFIQHINFSEFLDTNVRNISIGGNFITCDELAKVCHDSTSGSLSVVAKKLNFDIENVNGIACTTQHTPVDSLPVWSMYLEKLATQNVETNRYLAGILTALLCAMCGALAAVVYVKFRSIRMGIRNLSSSSSNLELTNAMELE